MRPARPVRLGVLLLLIGTVGAGNGTWTAAAQAAPPGQPGGAACTGSKGAVRIRAVPEASGLALGGSPPMLWTHNDSGGPVLFALDVTKPGEEPPREVRVTGAQVQDWEAVSTGPCPDGQCLYVGDIGDNNRRRQRITVFRTAFPEPGTRATRMADAFHAVYPDGPHDAEALFVTAAGQPFIITKDTRAGVVYRFPQALRVGAVHTLERVTELPVPLVTDAGTSADGAQLAVRTQKELVFYRTADVVAGRPGVVHRTDLRELGEAQGEGVAIGPGGMVYLTSEGGSSGGTLRVLRCSH